MDKKTEKGISAYKKTIGNGSGEGENTASHPKRAKKEKGKRKKTRGNKGKRKKQNEPTGFIKTAGGTTAGEPAEGRTPKAAGSSPGGPGTSAAASPPGGAGAPSPGAAPGGGKSPAAGVNIPGGGRTSSPAIQPGSIGGSSVEKAAKFLLLLGKDQAATIMKHLGVEEIEQLSHEIARIKKIDTEEANKILAEFGIIKEKGASIQGGAEVAKEMLNNAFGPEKAENVLKKAVPFQGNKPFDFLNEYEFQQILMILKHEPSSVLGVVLPYLEPDKASKIVEALTPETRKETVKYMAVPKKVDNEVLNRMENVIKEKIRTQGKVITEEVSGKDALANILRHVDPSAEKEILESLAHIDPDLSEQIRELMFTPDTVLQMYDQDLQKLLRDYADEEIALILKGKSEEIQAKMLSSVSERRRELIEEEMSLMGHVKRSDADKATKDFLRYMQTLAEEGKIRIFRRGEKDEFV
jgi:flagellar motor switch protein FliG